MLLKKIKLSNFKNFDEAEVELGKMNVLVGANASGKSNFLQAIKFLRDIQEDGLENAVSLQGGSEYLKNISSETNKLAISATIETKSSPVRMLRGEKGEIGFCSKEINYELFLTCKGQKCEVHRETLTILFDVGEFRISKKPHFSPSINCQVEIVNGNDGREPLISGPEEINIEEKNIFLNEDRWREFLFPTGFRELLLNHTDTDLDYLIYNFNPTLSKKGLSITGKAELEENGENIAIVLKKLLDDVEKRKSLINIISDILPFIKKLEVERFYDKTLFFTIQESFHQKDIPSSLLSDGTIAVTMIVVALFFEKKSLGIFEEPEHGIHPALIAKLMKLFYEASENKQILITTHNPEVVKHTNPQDLLLVSRQSDGSSIIKRPNDSQEVHTFLNNELGMDELFTQNLLDF